jgi:glycosyltransferase involved in cell wall biosynthesis
VIVPAFNEPKEVLEASLMSLRSQTFANFECLVVDESTDPTSSRACREFCERNDRFRWVRPEKRIGLAASLNLGLSMANGELFARFDSDDLCVADRLERQVSFLDEHKEIGVLGGALEIIDERGTTLAFRDYPVAHAQIERDFQTANALAHPTVMMRRQVIESVGGYNPEFRYSEDLELWLRMLNSGVRFANLPEVLVQYRQQDTRRNAEHWKFNLRARMKHFRFNHLARRLAGIAAIAVWSKVPAWMQRRVFQSLRLRRE